MSKFVEMVGHLQNVWYRPLLHVSYLPIAGFKNIFNKHSIFKVSHWRDEHNK